MKSQHFSFAAILISALWSMPGAARADTVLYDGTSLVTGQQAFAQSFTVATAGTFTMTVSNIPWLDVVSDLSYFVSTTKGVIGPTMIGAGNESIRIGPGTYYAHWFGDAQGPYNAGVLGIKMQFQAGTPVPLPRSLVLMVSGLGLLLGWRRRGTAKLAS